MKKLLPILLPILLIAGYYFGRQIYFTPNYSQGEVAPNFIGTKPDGSTFELKDLQGNYVLLEFWGSWCGDCRVSHPELVATYNKFNGKVYSDAIGFEIVSVGLETSEGRWKKAIEKDGLRWPYHTAQVAERNSKMFDQPLAIDYGIKWAPTSFLINSKGNIIKVNPSKSELDKYLSGKMK